MEYLKRLVGTVSVTVLCLVFGMGAPLFGQVTEPDVRAMDQPRTPVGEGYSNRIGGGIILNNFGIGIDGIFTHALTPYTELTFTAGITGIRDASEQSFTDYFTGQRTSPNRYQRALGFPFMLGLKKRIFPKQIADNFRFFVAASAGPAIAFTYPYFNDDGNGYRDTQLYQTPYGIQTVYIERKNDFFSGWGDGSTKWGGAGEIKVGVALGSNFKRQSTLEIGYFFYYFDPGLQLMEPFKPQGYDDNGYSQGQEPYFDPQKFFGTPQIKFTFSGWW